ncbi:MAG: hypothetical protein SRB2_04542 [Desulfobacteraceae bacterium Eth-SRB2]|nr:MAG: hypothetical protein SRB2_04542 [Desulfobacteraceae bacterium Eth-SRB2]
MKTTNLFVDFLIIGVLSFLALAGACYFAGISKIIEFALTSTKDRALLFPIGTVTIYVVGILVNQFADSFLKLLKVPFGLTAIEEAESNLREEVGVSYHEALQKTVMASQSAYDYLSYRRSVIRVFRSLTALSVVSPFVCLIMVFIGRAFGNIASWRTVAAFILVTIIVASFSRQRLVKLQVGYYEAIVNFYKAGEH